MKKDLKQKDIEFQEYEENSLWQQAMFKLRLIFRILRSRQLVLLTVQTYVEDGEEHKKFQVGWTALKVQGVEVALHNIQAEVSKRAEAERLVEQLKDDLNLPDGKTV